MNESQKNYKIIKLVLQFKIKCLIKITNTLCPLIIGKKFYVCNIRVKSKHIYIKIESFSICHFYTSLLSYFIYRQSEIHSLLIFRKGILIAPLDQRDLLPSCTQQGSMCCKSTRTYLLMICPLSALYNRGVIFLKKYLGSFQILLKPINTKEQVLTQIYGAVFT